MRPSRQPNPRNPGSSGVRPLYTTQNSGYTPRIGTIPLIPNPWHPNQNAASYANHLHNPAPVHNGQQGGVYPGGSFQVYPQPVYAVNPYLQNAYVQNANPQDEHLQNGYLINTPYYMYGDHQVGCPILPGSSAYGGNNWQQHQTPYHAASDVWAPVHAPSPGTSYHGSSSHSQVNMGYTGHVTRQVTGPNFQPPSPGPNRRGRGNAADTPGLDTRFRANGSSVNGGSLGHLESGNSNVKQEQPVWSDIYISRSGQVGVSQKGSAKATGFGNSNVEQVQPVWPDSCVSRSGKVRASLNDLAKTPGKGSASPSEQVSVTQKWFDRAPGSGRKPSSKLNSSSEKSAALGLEYHEAGSCILAIMAQPRKEGLWKELDITLADKFSRAEWMDTHWCKITYSEYGEKKGGPHYALSENHKIMLSGLDGPTSSSDFHFTSNLKFVLGQTPEFSLELRNGDVWIHTKDEVDFHSTNYDVLVGQVSPIGAYRFFKGACVKVFLMSRFKGLIAKVKEQVLWLAYTKSEVDEFMGKPGNAKHVMSMFRGPIDWYSPGEPREFVVVDSSSDDDSVDVDNSSSDESFVTADSNNSTCRVTSTPVLTSSSVTNKPDDSPSSDSNGTLATSDSDSPCSNIDVPDKTPHNKPITPYKTPCNGSIEDEGVSCNESIDDVAASENPSHIRKPDERVDSSWTVDLDNCLCEDSDVSGYSKEVEHLRTTNPWMADDDFYSTDVLDNACLKVLAEHGRKLELCNQFVCLDGSTWKFRISHKEKETLKSLLADVKACSTMYFAFVSKYSRHDSANKYTLDSAKTASCVKVQLSSVELAYQDLLAYFKMMPEYFHDPAIFPE